MKEPVWVHKTVVLALHEALLAEHGGVAGIRDEGLLDSALARPRNLFAYHATDLVSLSAAYIYGIIGNHPFLDGNKRTGFVVGALFLERNGKRLTAPEDQAAAFIWDLAKKTIDEERLAQWLQEHVRSGRSG